MCGIAGFITHGSKRADGQLVDKMLNRLTHRGPDYVDAVVSGNVGLGATRLSILDLTDSGNQPYFTDKNDGVLAYNGEVYNFMELKTELEKEGEVFKSRCDTEVVLKALHRWGPEEAVCRFNGMFAFIYHDLRDGTVWLGRDRAGIKPLYIARSGNLTAFASEVKSLLAHPDIACRPDMHSITTYIMMTKLDRWTPFENIDELLPGTLLALSEKGERSFTYFDPLRDLETHRLNTANGYDTGIMSQKLENLLSESVEAHLISDAPLAIMCSGGVDSSIITHFASRHRNDLTAYVIDVEGMKGEEVRRAGTVCDPLGVELRTVPVDRNEYLRLWAGGIWANDEPFYFQQTVLQMAVAKRAHEDGFKVLLCGEGADELFGGYGWQANAWEMWKRRRTHSRWLNRFSFLKPLIHRVMKTAFTMEHEALLHQPFRAYHSMHPKYIDWRKHAVIDSGKRFIRQKEWLEKLQSVDQLEDQIFLMRAFEDFAIHLATSLKNNDKVSMAYSVEGRFPFLSTGMIDFGLHLPRHLKYKDRVSKYLLKKTAVKHLPRDLVYAKKIGFGYDSNHWVGTKQILKGGLVEQMLKWHPSQTEHQLEMMENDKSLEYHLICLEIWARLFLDGQSEEQVSEVLMSCPHPSH